MNIITPTPTGITVANLRSWLDRLPPEFHNTPIEALVHGCPCNLKRIVAYSTKDGRRAVVANPMGTHMPFDDSLTWHFSLQG